MKRPFCVFASFFLLHTWAVFFSPWPWLDILLAASGASAGAVLLRKGRSYGRTLALLSICGCLASLLTVAIYHFRINDMQKLEGSTLSFTGYVSGRSSWNPQSITVLAQTDLAGHRTLRLSVPPGGPEEGDLIQGTMLIKEVRQDSGGLIFSGGISLWGVPKEELRLWQPQKRQPLLWRAFALRARLNTAIESSVPGTGGALLRGMLFSAQDGITALERSYLHDLGLGHLLSVSGLHLSILCGLLLGLCRHFKLGRCATLVVCIPGILVVVAASGFALSALRAAIMLLLFLVAHSLGRQSDGLTSLAIAAVVMVAFCPPALASRGFLYSFCATLAILLWAYPIRHGLCTAIISLLGHCGPVCTRLVSAAAVCLAAQAGVFPFLCFDQGWAPLYALPANLLASPLTVGVMILGVAGLLLLPMGLPGIVLLRLAALCANGILILCTLLRRLPLTRIPVSFGWQRFLFLLLCLLLLLTLALRGKKRRFLCALFPLWAVAMVCLTLVHQNDLIVVAGRSAGGLYLSQQGQTLLLYDNRSMTDYRKWALSVLPNYAGLPLPDCSVPYEGGSAVTASVQLLPNLTAQALEGRIYEINTPHAVVYKAWAGWPLRQNLINSGYQNSLNYDKIEVDKAAAVVWVDKDWNIRTANCRADIVRREDVTVCAISPMTFTGGDRSAAAKPSKTKRGYG